MENQKPLAWHRLQPRALQATRHCPPRRGPRAVRLAVYESSFQRPEGQPPSHYELWFSWKNYRPGAELYVGVASELAWYPAGSRLETLSVRGLLKLHRGVDQPHVRESLRKVAKQLG